MTSLFDEFTDGLMDVSGDGGSTPRPRRSLAESMIAGRRRPGAAAKPAAAGEEKPAPTIRRRRAAGSAAAAPEEAAPAAEPVRAARAPRAPRAASAPGSGSGASASAPSTPRGRRPATVAPAPAASGAPEAEAPAALVVPDAIPASPRVTEVVVPSIPELPPLPALEPISGDLSSVATEVGRLRALVEQQRTVLAELRAGMLTLGQQVDRGGYRPRLGIFVDVPNLMYGVEGGRLVHMGRLLNMLREGRQLVRATAYSPISDDPREPIEQQKFVAPFVPYDYRIVTKSLKRFADGSIKGNFDVEMAIDMVSMAGRVDVIAIVSGDADFARAVESVQNQGVRVEVVAFAGSTSLEMRALADHYLDLGTVVDRIS